MAKLVRDRIPEIMRREGKAPDVERISGGRLREALKDKLVEEARELQAAAETAAELREELADVLEVVGAIIGEFRLDEQEIRALMEEKRRERGGFEEGFYLKD